MLSRAHLLIEKEMEKLHSFPPWGVEIEPVNDDNFFEWMARIHGLRDTIWEGGIFQIYIKFDEHFNVRPPELFFQTIPFHPNVDMRTGRPCIDYLDNLELWQSSFSLSMMLVTLQVLLSNPNLNNAVNMEAVEMMSISPHTYRQMVMECVTASQRVDAGKFPHLDESKVTFTKLPKQPVKHFPVPRMAGPKSCTKLSFDDYHLTWKSIATSKPAGTVQTQLLEMLQGYPTLTTIHHGLPIIEFEEQLKEHMEEHRQIMFGRFQNTATYTEGREAKLAKLQRMKKIYLPPRRSPTPTPTDIIDPTATVEGKDWEKEAEDLVSWTKNLDDTAIDT